MTGRRPPAPLTPEQFAQKAAAIVMRAFAKLPEEERERRMSDFEEAVARLCAEERSRP